jgi:hypothetical protein
MTPTPHSIADFFPLVAAVVLLAVVGATIEPRGLAQWVWLTIRVAILWAVVHFTLARRRLVAVSG